MEARNDNAIPLIIPVSAREKKKCGTRCGADSRASLAYFLARYFVVEAGRPYLGISTDDRPMKLSD